MFYVVSFLALALFPSALAAYGGYLAAKVLDGKERRAALVIVWTLAILGVLAAGVQQFMVYRSDKANEIRQDKAAEKSEHETGDLKDEVSGLRTNTSNLISTIAGMFPMIASLNADLATLRRDTAAAKEHHDPRVINNLEHQAQTAQQQVDSLSHELLAITMAPQVAQQLRDWEQERKYKEEGLHNRAWENEMHFKNEHPSDYEGLARIDRDWQAAYAKGAEDSIEQLKRTIATADFIRKEMLQRIPPQRQSAEDKRQEKEFIRGMSTPDSLKRENAAEYLEDLARRVPPPEK